MYFLVSNFVYEPFGKGSVQSFTLFLDSSVHGCHPALKSGSTSLWDNGSLSGSDK